MRFSILAILTVLTLQLNAQSTKTINWINENSIKIEDADPDTDLVIFDNKIPKEFTGAKIFGFGEASHHGKEFFDIKAKFFKYLVGNQNVKVFIMEEFYAAESGINEWISGGNGNKDTIANNFGMAPWYTKEVVNLLEWMREYNIGKPREDQIRFYGMDIQFAKGINEEIRDFITKHNILINEELLSIADSAANKKVEYNKSTDWADIHNPKLKEIERIILDFQKENKIDEQDVESIIRALNYLIHYTYYVQHSNSEVRDLKMFENVKWIIENKTRNGKAFIWAHNEHINNKEFLSYGSGQINLGGHLKDYFKSDYYSVGFDFGIGNLRGYVANKNKPNYWENHQIEKPFHRTYAETLFEANDDIFFIDMKTAMNSVASSFFSDKKKQLILGAPGFNPKKYYLINKKFSEMFDGLIFIKNISVPDYNLKNGERILYKSI